MPIPSASKSWIGKSITLHSSENNPTLGLRPRVGLFSLSWIVKDFPIQLFEPDGNSIPIELMRFYYITTWFSSKVWNWSIPHFCKTYGIGQFHTFDENWISFKKSVKSQHFFQKCGIDQFHTFCEKCGIGQFHTFGRFSHVFPMFWPPNPLYYSAGLEGAQGGSFQPSDFEFYY